MMTVMAQAPKALAKPTDYDAWDELMRAGTIAQINLLNTGRVGDWGSHDVEHEISGIYDVAHGAGLAVVFPAWMKNVLDHDLDRFVQWSVRVRNVELDIFDRQATARAAIARLEAFFDSIGLGATLASLEVGTDRIDEMARKATDGDTRHIGNFAKLDSAQVATVLRLAARNFTRAVVGTGNGNRAKPRPFARKSNGQSRSKFYCSANRRRRVRAVRRTFGRATIMKISARNVLPGKVIALTKGATTAHVKIEIATGAVVTASITNEAVDALGLAVGKKASAVIKASDVMVAVD